MRHLFGCGLAVLGLVLSLSLPARADMPAGTISGFNEAVQSDDPAVIVAAARQMGATAIAHPEDPQAVAAAFEAANQLCLRGACADAVPMVTFLSQREESPPVSQAEFDVLAAFATWSASDAGATADDAFRVALAANETAQPSLLTVTAFEAFYVPATQTSDWAEITSRTHMAASHLKPVRDLVPDRWAVAELLSATADFNENRDFASYDKISDLAAWLRGKRRDEALKEPLRSLEYQAMAWRNALGAFFRSYDNVSFSNVSRDGRFKYQDEFDQAEERAEAILAEFPEAMSSEPPFCSGKVVKPPRPTYPSSAIRKGYVGAVLLGIDFEDGKVSNIEVLASIPDDTFAKASVRGMKAFRWKFDEVQEEPGCTRTKQTAMIYPFEYVMR